MSHCARALSKHRVHYDMKSIDSRARKQERERGGEGELYARSISTGRILLYFVLNKLAEYIAIVRARGPVKYVLEIFDITWLDEM